MNGKKIKFFDLTEVAARSPRSTSCSRPTPATTTATATSCASTRPTIPHLDRAKAKAALDFHREIAAAVEATPEGSGVRRRPLRPRPIVGIKQPTQQSAVRDGDRVKLLQRIGGEDPGGDGTVPRPSATRSSSRTTRDATYAAERHASLQNDDHVLLQLTGSSRGSRSTGRGYRAAPCR